MSDVSLEITRKTINVTMNRVPVASGESTGDMLASVYDPQTIYDDVFDRTNHTGTQEASTISDFDTEVENNSVVAANTSKLSGIEAGAEVNNISDANATDLTDGGDTALHAHTESIGIVISAYGADIEAATGVAYFDMPYAFTVTEVYGTMGVAPVGSSAIFDINEGGTSILTDLITVETGEVSSKTATTQPSLNDTSLASGARITFDIDQIGAGTAGQEVLIFLVGYRS